MKLGRRERAPARGAAADGERGRDHRLAVLEGLRGSLASDGSKSLTDRSPSLTENSPPSCRGALAGPVGPGSPGPPARRRFPSILGGLSACTRGRA
jgi:hypothetical protein